MEISIRDLGKILKKSGWVIILLAVIGAVIGWGLSTFIMDKQYRASAMVLVSSTSQNQEGNQNMTINDYNLSTKLVNSYRVLCKSDRVVNQVIDSMGLDTTAAKLAAMISVSAEQDTEILRISVTSTSPQFAQSVANTLVDVFRTEVADIMKMDNVQVIDYAITPTSPVSPNVTMNTAVGLLIGLVAGLIIAFLRYMLDDTIKDPDEVSNIIGAPVIGRIPKIST